MTMPHQCRCAICGEIGSIVPGLPNVFAELPRAYGGTGGDAKTIMGNTPIVPTELNADELATLAVGAIDRALVPTCTHGYTICKPCKFPT